MMTTTTETVNRLRRLALDGDLAAMQEIIIRLETAEKSDAESLSMYRRARDERDALRAELNEIRYGVAVAHDTIKALRAKVEAMEQQEPIDLRFPSALRKMWASYEIQQWIEDQGPLYALPGAQAQPAPSVPVEVVDLYNFMCAAFVPMTPQQEQIAIQLELAKRAMLAAAPKPEAKP